jgi:hypothetical protein
MSEQIGVVLVFAGLAAATGGALWLAVRGVAVLFGRRTTRQLLVPVALLGGGLVLGAVPFVAQHLVLSIFGLGERERVIDGKRALVLTGWDREDYAVLAEKRDVVILEMGNPDVTDATLGLLADLPTLRELTLNDTAITDTGLAALARLPSLETLRIARTKVTPNGVERFLESPPPRLRQLDVSGNGIPTGVLRRWKNAASDAEGERQYVN